MTVFYYGCNCGSLGTMIRKVKKYARSNNIEINTINTKYNHEQRTTHAQHLSNLEVVSGGYPAVIVDGESVALLSEWKP